MNGKQLSATISIILALAAGINLDADARGGHMGGGHMGGGHIASPTMGGFGMGRGRRGRGYGGGYGNYQDNTAQQQAQYFEQRRNENPYKNVPQHVNVSNYVKTYHF